MGCTLQVLSHEFYAWIEKEQGLLLQKSFPSETIKQKQQQKTPNQTENKKKENKNQTQNHKLKTHFDIKPKFFIQISEKLY